MTGTDALGFLAASLTTAAFVPQVVRIVRTRDTGAISLPMYLVFTVGIALWLAYGILRNELPIVAANVVTLALSATILFLKIRNG